MLFVFDNDSPAFDVQIFSATTYEGTPIEYVDHRLRLASLFIAFRTDEMRPEWFSIDEIPYHNMWADDIYWLPLLLAGKPFIGRTDFLAPDPALGEHSAGRMTKWWFGTTGTQLYEASDARKEL